MSHPPVLPGISDLLGRVINRWIEDPVPRLMASLLMGGAFFVLVLGAVMGLYLGMFLARVPGIIAEEPALMGVGMGVVFLVLFPALFLSMSTAQAVFQSGAIGALVRRQTQEVPLTWRSSLSELGPRTKGYVAHALVVSAASVVLVFLGFIPALLLWVALPLSLPGMVLYGWSTRESLERAMKFAAQEPLWHLGLFGALVIVNLVLSYVPLLGMGLAILFVAELNVEACIAAFGPATRLDLLPLDGPEEAALG